ncbi:MAG: T9SS type A sorting domain-containing protein [Candidatus Delongbacteria bacterium]|jgi:hypothetical protein|nr:T9SS type A sorting domain-containing protein [Candidatus Delongbacteria bacterium]
MRKFIMLLSLIISNLFAHGFAVHVSQYDKIIEYYDTIGYSGEYYQLLQAWPQYFKYGSILPDMQYINELKPALLDIYQQVFNQTLNHLTYEINMTDVPDVRGPNGSCSWGIDTHHPKYALQFAQYLLDQAVLPDPPGVDPGADEAGGYEDDPARAQKLALACGYYNHLVMDIGAHNYVVPMLTTKSGLHELSIFKSKDPTNALEQIPGIQSHMVTEAMHDYSMGKSANDAVADLVYKETYDGNQVWVTCGSGSMEPVIWPINYGGDNTDDWAYEGGNPALDFFYEVLKDWYNNNPYNLPDDYKISGGYLIPENGFWQECHMFRFSNRFYPEMMGYGSLPEVMANWISNHIDFSWVFSEILGFANSVILADLIHQACVNYSYDENIEAVKESVSSGAIHTLLGMLHDDPSYVYDYISTTEGAELINPLELNRFTTNQLYTDPNYFDDISHVIDFEAAYFDQIGPGGLLYSKWAPDYHHSYLSGVLSSLNVHTDQYDSRTDIAVYDSYFLVDGSRYYYREEQNQVGINHNFTAVAEVYALKEMQTPLNITAKVYLDKSFYNDVDNSLDILIKTSTTSMIQNPENYNSINRHKIEIDFSNEDIPTDIDINTFAGFYLELSVESNTPFFTMDWGEYEKMEIVQNNERYNYGYSTYQNVPYAFYLGNEPMLPELYVNPSNLTLNYEEQNFTFDVIKNNPANIFDTSFYIKSMPEWITIDSEVPGTIPETVTMKTTESHIDFTNRSGTIILSSPSVFVDGSNFINVTQGPCPSTTTEHLKPKLAVFDNTNNLVHYDPTDQHTIKTNQISIMDPPEFGDQILAIGACNTDADEIEEQVVLFSEYNKGLSLLFYELGESEYYKKIDLNSDFWGFYKTDIISYDFNNDGIDEIILMDNFCFEIYDYVTELPIISHFYDTPFTKYIKISSALGDFDSDGKIDISITDGNVVKTFSINRDKVEKNIPDLDMNWKGDAYHFRDMTSFNEDGIDRLIFIYQGLDVVYRYTTYAYEYIFKDWLGEFGFYGYGIDIPELATKDIRKIVSGNFIEDNGKDEFAILHSQGSMFAPSDDVTNTTCISIMDLFRVTSRPAAPKDIMNTVYKIDASDYIDNYLDITPCQSYDPLKFVLKAGTELVINPGDDIKIYPNAVVTAETGSKITVKNGAVLDLTNVTINGTDTWQGITAEIGSTITLSNATINNAETAIHASAANVDILNSSFTNCDNSIFLINCAFAVDEDDVVTCKDFILEGNHLYGKGVGFGVSLVHSDGVFENNTIKNYHHGMDLTLCSPTLTKNTITENTDYGLYITGYNALPMLIDVSETTEELNNSIYNNAKDKLHYQGGQIYMKYSASAYMYEGYNNIYSDNTNTPSIRGVSHYTTSKVAFPSVVGINAKYNYWGISEINDENYNYYFDLWTMGTIGGYRLSYEPYALTAYRTETPTPPINSANEPPTPESQLLSTAIKLESKDNYKPSIKLYEKVIDKYPESEEYYVATTRLPDIYIKAKLDTDQLIKIYDDAIASDSTSNKKFYKEMKISTKIKGKKYDDAISLAEEMKEEAETEGEIILADIDIAIASMMKDAESKGKNRSKVNYTSNISDLLDKLNGNSEEDEKTDIVESQLPTEFTLYQNYPNPFNPITTIRFALPTSSDVKINVYNINGQLISELVNGSKEAGIHKVNFDASNFNSGMYFYTLEANGMSITKKMILTK